MDINDDILDEIYLPVLEDNEVKSYLACRVKLAKYILNVQDVEIFFEEWDIYRLLIMKSIELRIIKNDYALYLIGLLLNKKVKFSSENEKELYIVNVSNLKILQMKLMLNDNNRKRVRK